MTTNLADENNRYVLSHSSVGETSWVVATCFFAQGLTRLKYKCQLVGLLSEDSEKNLLSIAPRSLSLPCTWTLHLRADNGNIESLSYMESVCLLLPIHLSTTFSPPPIPP